MTQHIQETAITQRVEFAETELKEALRLFNDFSDTNQILSSDQMSKIEHSIGMINTYFSEIDKLILKHEELLTIKNKK